MPLAPPRRLGLVPQEPGDVLHCVELAARAEEIEGSVLRVWQEGPDGRPVGRLREWGT